MPRSREHRLDTARDTSPVIGEMPEPASSLRRDHVVDACTPLDGASPSLYEPALLEQMQRWIQHTLADRDCFGREHANRPRKLVAVHLTRIEELQDQERGDAGHERGGRRVHK